LGAPFGNLSKEQPHNASKERHSGPVTKNAVTYPALVDHTGGDLFRRPSPEPLTDLLVPPQKLAGQYPCFFTQACCLHLLLSFRQPLGVLKSLESGEKSSEGSYA
jgi:hypothetical protein